MAGLDAYRLLGQLGAGPDGVTYRAEPCAGGNLVALTRLDRARSDGSRWPPLVRRLAVAAGVAHPSVRGVVEDGTGHEPPFLVRPLGAGRTLREARDGAGPVPVADAVGLARSLAGAVAAGHRVGLIHGGLDPWSVREGDRPGAVVVDLTGVDDGDPSAADPEPFRDAFRAPEVRAGGEPTAEADVYSLGALAAWLLTGASPSAFEGPGPGLPPALRALVRSLRSPDPDDRPSATEAERRLGEALSRLPADALATGDGSSGGSVTVWGASDPDGSFSLSLADLRLTGGSSPESPGGGMAPGRLGRYRLGAKLGEGGMGEVYRAVDESDGSPVALKVLRPALAGRERSLKRFLKEARLLARVRNPYVTALLAVNEDRGVHYLALEYVAGEPLDRVLAGRGRLDERTALGVAADVARGLADAHRLGIVHRDVKPSNVLVVGGLADEGAPDPPPGVPRVKLADFGLARLDGSEDAEALTQTGVIVGTPAYMAPEQGRGDPVDARTDVYGLGATMFHLVAGRPPFVDDDWRGVVARQINDPPPPLRSLNPEVSEGYARVVEKALAKAPDRRYADAEAMLADLERLLRGEPTGVPVHPALPEADPGRVLAYDFAWDLDAPPRRLWPYASDTDRIDRALGFAAVRYTLRFDPERGVRRFLEGRTAGLAEEGEEHPYEWVEGRRLGVFREYARGPFRWVVSVVELAPRPGGGTTLTHHLRFEPRGRLFRLGARWGVGSALRKEMGRVYRRIDAAVSGRLGAGPAVDPFEPPAPFPEAGRERLDALAAELVRRGNDPETVARLAAYFAEAPAQELARIRPVALARRLGLPEDAVVDACLHGASVGLLVLLWDLLCPVCRVASEVKETLRAVAEHGHCAACHLDFPLDFAHSIELTFRADPRVRRADTATYCAAGPAHSPHVVAQVRIAPGERLELDLALSEGAYRLRGPQLGWALDLRVRPGAAARRRDLSLGHGPGPGPGPVLDTGGQWLGLHNDTDRPLVVRVERVAPRDDALTAARAATLAVFRELFPGEVLAPGRLVAVSAVTLLLTAPGPGPGPGPEGDDPAGGDGRAFAVLHEHFARVEAVVRREGGAVVKSLGGAVLAAFHDPEAALRAGLAVPDALGEPGPTRGLRPRTAAHRGPALAATAGDRLDYFGLTVHEAMRALERTPPGSFVLTRAVAEDPRVAGRLTALGLTGSVLPDDPADRPFGPLLRVEPAGGNPGAPS